MTDIDPRRYLLSQEESERIFREDIVPEQLSSGVSQPHPTVVFVAGQPGAGKTRTTEMVKDALDQRGGAIVVNSDFYKPYHPEYDRLMAEDDRTAAPYTSMDGRRWMAAAEQHLMDNRIDTIVETTMRDPGDFAEPAAAFRAAGYRVETAVMAVPESLSRLGIVQRYHEQVESMGHGRLTQQANHDASYAGVLDAATSIDQDKIVDGIGVYRRGNELLYANELNEAGEWTRPAGARDAIEAERNRPFTPAEARSFLDRTADLRERLGPEWQGELDDITARAQPLLGAELADDRRAEPAQAAAPDQAAAVDQAAALDHAADQVERAHQAIDAASPPSPAPGPTPAEPERTPAEPEAAPAGGAAPEAEAAPDPGADTPQPETGEWERG